MRILRLRLNNLNSLRGSHMVDFEAPPLANAGLFAITGQTGAGKSTLLDAITLALYGRAARYASAPNPEDMMSRHCGECRAEVEFQVAAGQYRAEWHLRRARGRPDGSLQPPKRYLYDGAGQILAQSLREVDEQIEKLVGLDYDRFLRSVLLAQGEFARFLKAKPDERAGLLESLTGATIYSELSLLAHEETTGRERALQLKEAALGQFVLLTEEQRREREAWIQEQAGLLAAGKERLEQLNAALGQARHLRDELVAEADLQRQARELDARWQTAGPSLASLARHRLTAPYADDLAQLDAAEAGARDQAASLRAAETAWNSAHGALIAGILAACGFASQTIQQEERKLAELAQALKSQQDRQREAQAWLVQNDRDKILEPRLPEMVALLGGLETLRQDLGRARGQAAALSNQASQQQQALAGAGAALRAAEEHLCLRNSQKDAPARTLADLLAGCSEADREAGLNRLRTQAQTLAGIIGQDDSRQKLLQAAGEDRRQLAGLRPKLESASAAAQAAATAREAAASQLNLRRDHLEKARLVASLAEHRAALRPGEACPLCGALEHPLAVAGQAGPSGAEIQAEVTRAEKALARADQEARAADQEVIVLKTRLAALEGTIARGDAGAEEHRRRIQEMATAGGLEPVADQGWLPVLAATNSRIDQLAQEIARIRQAAQAVTASETACVAAGNACAQARQARENQENLLASLNRQLAAQGQAVADLEARISTTSASLAALLADPGVAVPPPGQEPAARQILQRRKAEYQARQAALQLLAAEIQGTQSTILNATQSVSNLREKAGPLFQARVDHAASAAPASAPPPSRWRILDDAERDWRALESKFSQADFAVRDRQAQAAQATRQVSGLGGQLAAKLAGSTFATIESLRGSRLAPARAGELEQLEQSLQSQSDILKGRLEEGRRRIAGLRAAGTVEGEGVAGLEAELRTAQAAHQEMVARQATLRNELARDDRDRALRAAQAAEVEQDQQRLQVWRLLQGLIGSHDGGKFRRYAQGISLDILLHHANRHLQRLSDRYRTRRCAGQQLELEIEDLYQSGATRPMASLSGGESFLASLALALGLADLAGRKVRIDCLFIDEGFGALDAGTLDLALSALETLRQDSKTVGVISHVDLLKERIATQIIVDKLSGGASCLRFAP